MPSVFDEDVVFPFFLLTVIVFLRVASFVMLDLWG